MYEDKLSFAEVVKSNTSAEPWLRKNQNMPVTWLESETGQTFIAYYYEILEVELWANRILSLNGTLYFNEYLNQYRLLPIDDYYRCWYAEAMERDNSYTWIDFTHVLHLNDDGVYVEIKYPQRLVSLRPGERERNRRR